MKLIINQVIMNDKNYDRFTMYKEFETQIIPVLGAKIEDSAFKDPYDYEVVDVTISYQSDTCSVFLEPFVIEEGTMEHIKMYADMMILHGWKSH